VGWEFSQLSRTSLQDLRSDWASSSAGEDAVKVILVYGWRKGRAE